MALDAGMIACLANELREQLVGGKLEKIHQPEKDEIDLHMRAGGKAVRLALSAAPGNPRMNISELPKENPAVPPMFCTLLRKHLTGGILLAVEQLGFERAVRFRFRSRDEMGFETERTIIIEMMGKYCNLIFTDGEDKILAVLRPVDFASSEKRQLLSGMAYTMPPLQEGKEDPTTETKENFLLKATAAGDRPADKFIMSGYRGISPLVAREIAYLASGMTDPSSAAFAERLWSAFDGVMTVIREGRFTPTVIKVDGKNTEYSFIPITQYGGMGEEVRYDSPSVLIDDFHADRERGQRVHRRAQDLFKTLTNAESRLLRKMEAQREELRVCAQKEQYKQFADLITANLYAIKQGQRTVTVINYYSEEMEEVTLELDPRLSPAANAQFYFKKYNKAKNAERELAIQLEKGKVELQYLSSVLDALARAVLPSDIDEIRAEMVHTGYASALRIPPSKKLPPAHYHEYRTTNGFRVLCGRNNLQNDALTFKVAEKNDWWFHVHGAPGSHVLLITDGVDDPPAEDFTDAAVIAACNSKLADGVLVTVDYTKARNVKKPPAARPGYVIYHTNYSAVVTPDQERCTKMKVR